MIVTENYAGGYSPDYRDCFWAMYNPGGGVEEEGDVRFCIRCHAQRDYNDYVFSTEVR